MHRIANGKSQEKNTRESENRIKPVPDFVIKKFYSLTPAPIKKQISVPDIP